MIAEISFRSYNSFYIRYDRLRPPPQGERTYHHLPPARQRWFPVIKTLTVTIGFPENIVKTFSKKHKSNCINKYKQNNRSQPPLILFTVHYTRLI